MIIQIIGAVLLLLLIVAIFGAIGAVMIATADRGPIPNLFDQYRFERDHTLIVNDDVPHGDGAWFKTPREIPRSARIRDLPEQMGW